MLNPDANAKASNNSEERASRRSASPLGSPDAKRSRTVEAAPSRVPSAPDAAVAGPPLQPLPAGDMAAAERLLTEEIGPGPREGLAVPVAPDDALPRGAEEQFETLQCVQGAIDALDEQRRQCAQAAYRQAFAAFEVAHRPERQHTLRARSEVIKRLTRTYPEVEFWQQAIGNNDVLAEYTYDHQIWEAMDYLSDVNMDFPQAGEARSGTLRFTLSDKPDGTSCPYFEGTAPFVLQRGTTVRKGGQSAPQDAGAGGSDAASVDSGAGDGAGSSRAADTPICPPLTASGRAMFAIECQDGVRNLFSVLFADPPDMAHEARVLSALSTLWDDPLSSYLAVKETDEGEGEQEAAAPRQIFTNTLETAIELSSSSDEDVEEQAGDGEQPIDVQQPAGGDEAGDSAGDVDLEG